MHPTTIYFSDKKIPYGNFYPINSENTILDLQYNEEEDYNYSVLYLNYESSQSTILYENENNLRQFLGKSGFSLFEPNTDFVKTENFQKKLFYYYPEYRNVTLNTIEITVDEINNSILSSIYLEQISNKPGLLIPIETFSKYYYDTDLYGYIFIDLSAINTFKELKTILNKILPIVKVNYSQKYSKSRRLFYSIFNKRALRLKDLKQKLTSVKMPFSGFNKILLFDLKSKVRKTPDVYFSLPEKKKDENDINFSDEFDYSKMLMKASAIKNNIKELAENGFEELALLAIIKGFNLSQETNIVELNQKFSAIHNGLPKAIEAQWFAETHHQLSRLIITHDYKIILLDYGELEIKLNPLHKSLYLLFLSHPEGIYFSKMEDYKEELLHWYYRLSNRKISETFEKSIADICNPMENSLYEKLSRIKKEFVTQMDDRVAKMYYITSLDVGSPKKIALPNELIFWEK